MNYAEACRIGPGLVAKYYRPPFTPVIMPTPIDRDARRAQMRINYKRWYDRHKRAKVPTPTPDEITMKQWQIEEAARIGLTRSAVAMRLTRGKYPHLQVRRVNRRVAYVRVDQKPTEG